MRVLLLTQVLPYPPDSGPKIKTWNLVKYLHSRHETTVVSFVRGDQSADVRRLEEWCSAVHTLPLRRGRLLDALMLTRSLWKRTPFVIERDDRQRMRQVVRRIAAAQPFDLVHVDQLNMAPYAFEVPASPRILDAHNALWVVCRRLWQHARPGPKRWLLGREWRVLKRYEQRTCGAFDAVLAVSDQDKMALEGTPGGNCDISVIPITIDTQEIRPLTRNPAARRIIHIGSLLWPPNTDAVLWFAQTVLPLIRARRSDVILDIVGTNPPAQVSALARLAGITVTGYLADPTPVLAQAGVAVVPVRAGGGMRVKILTAFAYGIPIVSTTLGCEGIDATPGEHLLVADEPAAFAEAVLRVLDSPSLSARLVSNGRRLVERRYDYREACRPLDAVYARVVQRGARRTRPAVVRPGMEAAP